MTMLTTLIFSQSATGHVLEYFHHIYEMCMSCTDRKFVFIVPEEFEKLKGNKVWRDADNIKFDYLSSLEVETYSGQPALKLSRELTRILNEKIHLYQADKVLSLFWFPLVPFGPFVFPKTVKASAIFYDVYLREIDELSWKAKLRHYVNFWLLSRSAIIDTCYILNDSECAVKLNGKFHTSKSKYLPDPFNTISDDGLFDFRKENEIGENQILFAHFGGLSERKGTLTIVESFPNLSDEEKRKYVFVFAGKIYDDIKARFYKDVKEITDLRIIIKDEFCSDAYLASLCNACNAILIPYKYSNRSSGLLGYASQYHKPLIGPKNGLLADVIKEYQLGISVDEDDINELKKAYIQIDNGEIPNPTSEYCACNSIFHFCEALRNSLM